MRTVDGSPEKRRAQISNTCSVNLSKKMKPNNNKDPVHTSLFFKLEHFRKKTLWLLCLSHLSVSHLHPNTKEAADTEMTAAERRVQDGKAGKKMIRCTTAASD